MKLTGPACAEAMNEAEEARRRERAEDNAGGVRVELRVRPLSYRRWIWWEKVLGNVIGMKQPPLLDIVFEDHCDPLDTTSEATCFGKKEFLRGVIS
jgi:hypothetical protein